jgi:hypothetical protein
MSAADDSERLELALEELEVLSRHLADATVTIERLRARLVELEALEARSLRARTRRLVDRLLGIPAPRPLSAELPPTPPIPPEGSAAARDVPLG